MQRAIAFIFILAASAHAGAGLARSSDASSDATAPLSAPLPPLPEACAGQPTLSGEDFRFVTLFGVIDWEGRATQVQVQDPSDECLKKTGVEAVREWRFEPVEPDANAYLRQHFETTLIYPSEGAPRFEMSDNDSIKRVPPRYPERCIQRAGPIEMVAVTLDVTEEGRTENIEPVFSSNRCLTSSAVVAVKKWRYRPRVINGHAFPITGAYSELTFELSKSGGLSARIHVLKELISISNTLERKLDPRIALEKIALFERRFGEDLVDSDRASLLRYRGSAKIDAMDYRGALEDLRAALELEKDEAMAANIKGVIAQLEAALAEAGAETSQKTPAGDGR